MALSSLRALAQSITASVLGVPITVTVPNGDPVETRGVWDQRLDEQLAYGTDLARRDPRKVLAIQRTDTLTGIPKGSVIAAPETDDGEILTWRVDGYARPMEVDQMRVIVVPSS